jgi:ornithine cyclodeaminase/alanine dehydrogenase-like protein (mu-crystallin family)
MRVVDGPTLRAALPISAAIDALKRAWAAEDPSLTTPLRTSLATPAGTLLMMPAAAGAGVGVKLVTLTEPNAARGLPFVQAAYVLFDADTQRPEAVVDGTELTALRTAAVSGLATSLLARSDAHRLVLFGAGVQATSHLDAMRAVRPIDDVVVVSRTPASAAALADRATASGVRARVGEPADVASADLVCTCTTSAVPLFDGSLLPDGVHVNAVGAYRAETRELDTETVRRARVVVETREVAFAEAGDVLIPIAEGAVTSDHVVADLQEVIGGVPVRVTDADITVFVSVGMAFEDLVVARAALDALR